MTEAVGKEDDDGSRLGHGTECPSIDGGRARFVRTNGPLTEMEMVGG